MPLRSSIFIEKPVALPSDWIGGGFSGNTVADAMPDTKPNVLPMMVSTLFSAPGRSSHGWRSTNDNAADCPWPKKLKPTIDTMFRTCGCSFRKASVVFTAASVRCIVDPGAAS